MSTFKKSETEWEDTTRYENEDEGGSGGIILLILVVLYFIIFELLH